MCQHFILVLWGDDLKVTDLKIKSRQIKAYFELRFPTPFPFDSKATQTTILHC